MQKIAITGGKGGVGKSTIAVLFANKFLRENIEREEFRALIEKTIKGRGQIEIIPFRSEAGEILKKLGSIVAILRFKVSAY